MAQLAYFQGKRYPRKRPEWRRYRASWPKSEDRQVRLALGELGVLSIEQSSDPTLVKGVLTSRRGWYSVRKIMNDFDVIVTQDVSMAHSEEAQSALWNMQNHAFLNKDLRAKKKITDDDVRTLDRAFKRMKPLRRPILTYRGIFKKMNLKRGDIFKDPGFPQVSWSRAIATRFAENGSFFEVTVMPGTRVINMRFSPEVSEHLREDELDDEQNLLLPRNTVFRVTEVLHPYYYRVETVSR